VLLSEGFALSDYPWLVRLNPAAPWKTRGNGAVALLIEVESRREAVKAARISVQAAKAYVEGSGSGARKASLQAIYVEDAWDPESFATSRPACLERLYRRGIHELVSLRQAEECLKDVAREGNLVATLGPHNRGVIGSLAALGYTPEGDYTFELLTYRAPENWLSERKVDANSVLEYDVRWRPDTFMNYDYELDKPLIAPHGYDPVLYGVRGERPDVVRRALESIDTGGEEPTHWLIFRSNQATGHHLRPKTVAKTRPYDNPLLLVELVSRPKTLQGGHVLAKATDHTGVIHLAAYRETGVLRDLLLSLRPGAVLAAGGQAKMRNGVLTLNLEVLDADTAEANGWKRRLCGFWHPPLARLHHLSLPYQRCRLAAKDKTWGTGRLLLPDPAEAQDLLKRFTRR